MTLIWDQRNVDSFFQIFIQQNIMLMKKMFQYNNVLNEKLPRMGLAWFRDIIMTFSSGYCVPFNFFVNKNK